MVRNDSLEYLASLLHSGLNECTQLNGLCIAHVTKAISIGLRCAIYA